VKNAKKKKRSSINIKINDVDKLIEKGKKWYEKDKKEKCMCKCMKFCGFGSALAIVLSYAKNSSIFWAIIHGILSWIYVVYRIIIDYNLFK
jgi:hypothetical protein